jgi:hypothetical protein
MARTFLAALALTLGLACFQPPAHAVVAPLKQPSWVELSVEQREILAPLAGEWDQLEQTRRKKWLGIAERYPTMGATEQARVQRRMIDWVKLSPEERKLAREKFKTLQKAPPEHKESVKQKWQEYKELPDEEKQRLQAEAEAKAAAKPKMTHKGGAPTASSGQKPSALPLPALGPAMPPASPPVQSPAPATAQAATPPVVPGSPAPSGQ